MEIAIKDLVSDFTLAQALTAEQVVSLEKEFSELTERIKEELPLILNSYLEVALDNQKGKRSLTEKFIHSAVDAFMKEVNNSDAWIFYSSLIRFNLHKEFKSNYIETIIPITRRSESMEELMSLRDSKEIDFLRYVSDFELPHRLKRTLLSLPWIPSNHKNLRTQEFIKAIKISKKDLVDACKSKKQQTVLNKYLDRIPNSKVSINYFSDPFDLMIMEALTQDPKAREVMMGYFAIGLIEYIRDVRNERKGFSPKLKLSSEGFNLSDGEDLKTPADVSINLIVEDTISRLLEHHISDKSKEIKAISVDKNMAEWAKLQEAISLFGYLLRQFDEPQWRKALRVYLGDQEEIILEEIFTFLSDNNLNPCNIPTIAELGKHKGGYALVKSISEAGGLKSIRKKYVPWSIKKTREIEMSTNKDNDWRNETNSKYDRDEDKMMALYASEAADPGSTGINMSLEEISDLTPGNPE